MFTAEDINNNKQRFIELIESIAREGLRKEELLKKLESSDFYTAPASTKFHYCIEGGLCAHSLNVYDELCMLVKMHNLEDKITEDSIKIVALFHDISKMNFYMPSVRNKKEYFAGGSKHDEFGNFDWVAEKTYIVRPTEERFLFGNHEETSEYIISQYIPLTYIESSAIMNHHFGKGYDSTKADMSAVATRYPLVILLHLADMLAAYVKEV